MYNQDFRWPRLLRGKTTTRIIPIELSYHINIDQRHRRFPPFHPQPPHRRHHPPHRASDFGSAAARRPSRVDAMICFDGRLRRFDGCLQFSNVFGSVAVQRPSWVGGAVFGSAAIIFIDRHRLFWQLRRRNSSTSLSVDNQARPFSWPKLLRDDRNENDNATWFWVSQQLRRYHPCTPGHNHGYRRQFRYQLL